MSSPPVVGWILYDFASTTFSFVVVTRYYNDWIIDERGQPDIYVGVMVAAVSLALVVALPVLGALADRRGRHKPILVAFTLLCVVATALLGFVESVLLALVVGAIATFAFHAAESQYHPLLSVVAPEDKRARVSGSGVAVGLLAPLCGVLVIGSFVADGQARRAFLPAAVMILAFALPLFAFVRERPRPQRERGVDAAPRRPLAQLAAAVRRAWSQPHGRLLLARFFYLDAILTALQFMTVYARRTGDLDGADIDLLVAISALIAIAGAFGAGLLAERIGPRRVVLATIAMIATALVLAAATGSSDVLWIVGPMLGVSLGALSAVDRVFLLRLVSPERRGEGFALYALVGRLSTGFGPLVLWGATILVATELGLSAFDASRIAVLVLAAAAVVGLLILRPLPDRRPRPG